MTKPGGTRRNTGGDAMVDGMVWEGLADHIDIIPPGTGDGENEDGRLYVGVNNDAALWTRYRTALLVLAGGQRVVYIQQQHDDVEDRPVFMFACGPETTVRIAWNGAPDLYTAGAWLKWYSQMIDDMNGGQT